MKAILATLGAAVLLATACTKNNNSNTQLEQVFKRSMELKDYPTAISSVHLLLSTDSTHALRDTLPALYFLTQNVDACLKTAEESLVRKPNDEELSKYKLLCLEQVGKPDEVMALAKQLHEKTGKAEYMYKIASVEIISGNFEKAGATIDAMEERYKSGKDSVDIFVDQSQSQRVPLLAACWNMRGYIYIQTQKYQQAAEAYQKAIQTFPDFVMARRNLQQLMQGMQPRR